MKILQNINPSKIKRQVIGTVILILIILVIYRIIRKIRDNVKERDTIRKAKGEINQNDLSFSDYEFKSFADRIFNAMDGIGTEETAIFHILKQMKTKSDMLALIVAFDTRKSKRWYSSFEGNMIAWLQNELDSYEHNSAAQIFQKLGIAY